MRGCAVHGVGDGLRKRMAIDGQRGARRHARRIGRAHDDRAEPAHLFFDQPDGVIDLVGAERIAADELGQSVGLMHGGRPHRPHLVNGDVGAELGRLPGRLATREPAANDVNHLAARS